MLRHIRVGKKLCSIFTGKKIISEYKEELAFMLQLIDLKVEDRTEPLGIDTTNPRFSWSFGKTQIRGLHQTAYRILVSDNQQHLDHAHIWDSGKIQSRKNALILYDGPELQSGKRYYWKVYVWDKEQVSTCSQLAWWEMGLLHEGDWMASWIGVDPNVLALWEPASGYVNNKPLPLFRHEFHLGRMLTRARAYICGLGHFELRINGVKVGDRVLEPGWTNYGKSCLYVVNDITSLLQNGANAVGVMLGNGFYNVNEEPGRYMKNCVQRNFVPKRVLQDDPKLIVQLALEFADGTTEWVLSNESWTAAQGPILYSCLYGGEDYDARKEKIGWDLPGYIENASWSAAAIVLSPGGYLKAEMNPPNKIKGIFHPVSWTEPTPGVYVADLGQNFSGWFQLTLNGGTEGQRIVITPAELLDEQGKVWQELEQKEEAWNFFVFTKKGSMQERWAPRFTYTGYRFVQVEGAIPKELLQSKKSAVYSEVPVIESFEGQLIYPDVPTIGSFSCSNPMWNRIHEIINWAILSNVKSTITDCPHREKLGWLEEVHLMGPAIMYNYELPNLFRKSVHDMSEAQLEEGLIPSIAPEYAVFIEGFLDSPEWGGAFIIVPWYLYHWYGDLRILEKYYQAMTHYVSHLTGKAENGIVSHGLGDWADVGPNPPHAQNTPIPITATCYYYYMLKILQETSKLLNKLEESERYGHIAEEVNQSFHAQFFNADTNQYGSGSQTSNASPITLGLTDKSLIDAVLDNICKDVAAKGYHTTSGDVGHRLLLSALADGGRSDFIAKMLNQTDDPSYGYQILHGATALTEHWDGPTMGKSQNHFMLGHVEEWFYRYLAGIVRDYDGMAAKDTDIVIKPFIAEGIEWTSASHRFLQGEVCVTWTRKDGDVLSLEVELPPNVYATIYVPTNGRDQVFESGTPIEQISNLAIVGTEVKYIKVRTGSGKYVFLSNLS
jgi:alpha-L-rhamnosidase